MFRRLIVTAGVLLFVGGTDVAAQSFMTRAVELEAALFSATALGDLDLDGDLDVVIAGVQGQDNVTRVYLNTGNGQQFTEVEAGLAGVVGVALALGDYDGDGDLDLIVSGEEASLLYRNDRGQPLQFTAIDAGLPGVARVSGTLEVVNTPPIAWADYDNDGDQDLLIATQDDTDALITRLYRNMGDDGFSEIDAQLPPLTNNTLAWGDYDRDGDLDLVVASRPSAADPQAPHQPFISVLRNEDGGAFTDIEAGLPGIEVGSVDWGDYDQDGDLDVLVSGDNEGGTAPMGIYRNLGNDQFAYLEGGLSAGWYGRWVDFDNDGDLDVLQAEGEQTAPTIRVRRNEGGTFSETVAELDGVWWGAIALGDMDADGDLDILAMGDVSPGVTEVRYFENIPSVANQRPSAPTDIQGNIVQRGQQALLMLSWEAGADPETPTAALSYNLRVGTAPGSQDVLPALSLTEGTRLVPASGNVGHTLTWTLVLPDIRGRYYCAVQAVDSGWRGSAYSQEIEVFSAATDREGEEHPRHPAQLWPGYPNPFSSTATLRYSIEQPGEVQIGVYDLRGRLIATPFSGPQPPGDFSVTWSGRDQAGRQVAAGVYLVQLISLTRQATQRLVFLP